MKYFYTDPLAAAWMAKHFGMSFESPCVAGLDYCRDTGKLIPSKELDTISIVKDIFDFEPADGLVTLDPQDKYYIHPDSLHLLEPKVRDIAWMGDDVGYLRQGQYTDGSGKHWYIAYPDGSGGGTGEEPRIVQRNNIAFHWPESE